MLILGIVSVVGGVATLLARRFLTGFTPLPFERRRVERRGLVWSEVARKKVLASGIFFIALDAWG